MSIRAGTDRTAHGWRGAAIGVGLAAALAGCRVWATAWSARIGAAEPAGAPLQSRADVARALEAVEAGTRTMTALFRVVVHTPNEERTSRGALVVARPDRLRLQIFGFGAMTVFDYAVDGERWRIRRPLEGKDENGRFDGSADAAPSSTPFDLRPLFLRDLGAAPRVRDAGEAWVVTFANADAKRVIEMAKKTGTITRETVFAGGERQLVADYSDYRPVEGLALPFRIDVRYPPKNAWLEIDVQSYTRNQPTEPGVFAMGTER